MIFWSLLSAGAATVAAPFVAEAFRPRVTDSHRQAASGHVAYLPDGPTWFQWRGPEDGPVAVCVHGLTTPSFVWGPLADHLADRGFRVLTYDLYGRGLSARPKGEQDSAFFNAQLAALLDHQGIAGDFTLLGYSMGGAIATGFAAAYPARVSQLCLIAPAGLGHDLGPVVELAINHPNIGRGMMLGFYPRSLRRSLESERGLPSSIPDMVDLQIAETRKQGFAPAVHGSLRGIMDEDLAPAHRTIAEAGIPILAIWGETDDVIPLAGRDRLAKLNPDVRNIVIANAGHAVAYTHVEDVARVLDSLRFSAQSED